MGRFSKLKRSISPTLKARNLPQTILTLAKKVAVIKTLRLPKFCGINNFLNKKIPSLY
jgi:hypothetical protein